MADSGDRGGRRRRRRGVRKVGEAVDMERDLEKDRSTQPAKTPIILAKPHAERTVSKNAATDPPPKSVEKPAPVVMLKVRDGESRSSTVPGLLTNSNSASDSNPGSPHYQLQRHPTVNPAALMEGDSQSRLAAPSEMSQSIKLVDESMQWCDNGMEMLQDQTDFLTIGVLGPQGAGKSTILSLLAGNSPMDHLKSYAFRPQLRDTREVGAHQTCGIDMFVTSERMILLDSQPVMSASVLDYLIHHDKKYPAEFSTAENCIEMQSLQLATFMMTVCNVVIVVQDWFADANLLRFLQKAEMLKPPTPSAGHEGQSQDDNPEYYPYLVFLQNKAGRSDFGFEGYRALQYTLSKVFKQSKLRYKGSVSMANGNLLPGLRQEHLDQDVNLFLLPNMDEQKPEQDAILSLLPDYRGYPSFELLLRSFRNQVFSVPRHLLTHTTLSEKNWFHYAARTWDAVRKSTLLQEYNRLLPREKVTS